MDNESVKQLTERLKETQEFREVIGKHLGQNFLINGKTMKEWKVDFKIDIPEEITFPIIVKLAQDIWIKYQRAAYFRDSHQVQLVIMEQIRTEKYNNAYQLVRQESEEKFQKPLAAESCKAAASIATQDLESAIQNQKVIHSFWSKTCDTLTELRKLLEVCGFALQGDAKIQRDVVFKG